MTEDEARRVLIAASHADGGCSHCLGLVVDKLAELIPEWLWLDWEKSVRGEALPLEDDWRPKEAA